MIKLKFAFILFGIFLFFNGCNYQEEENRKEIKKEVIEEIIIEEEIEYTEEEYKNICVEMYNDDFFKSTPDLGKYVKIYVMASSKYKYSSSDMQGIIVQDITEKYNLSMNCLGCTVMHESTKEGSVPSYFGSQIYIMFVDGENINLDTFETGQKIIIYGEIIKNTNGIFVLPKYYEEDV